MSEVRVTAFKDLEADVWVAESDDVPGLITEADTLEELVPKLRVLIPELLSANGKNGHGDVPFTLEVKDVAHALEA
jgi:predicted RNase H-like HicB family nuclease